MATEECFGAEVLSGCEIRERLADLGDWFHNLNLRGIQTAPQHFLGDFPAVKWRSLGQYVPTDLSGKSVLDIGCNGGFYSIEMKRRGAARVLGVDSDQRYLEQARFAAKVLEMDIDFQRMSVYEVGALQERFDVVLFMGVLYHLRYPLLALDLLAEHVVKDLLVFQTLTRGGEEVAQLRDDYPFTETSLFSSAGYPVLHFVERSYAGDPTNWWIPNGACAEAILRSAGFVVTAKPDNDTFICRSEPNPTPKYYLEELRASLSSL